MSDRKIDVFKGVLYILTILSTSFLSVYQNKVSILFILAVVFCSIIFVMLIKNNFNYEEIIITIFILGIPFFTDLDLVKGPADFHMVARTYMRFNFMYLFALAFLYFIIRNIRKVIIRVDLILVFTLVGISFLSMIWAKNPAATFFDAIRYLVVLIYYVYFSRIYDYKRYNNRLINCLIISVVFQLIIGILQIVNDGPIGLRILGETKEVFRVSVTGYEKGMSGTFGHPGPLALYTLFILSCILFNDKLNKVMKYIGVISSVLIIILAAGRTSIVLLMLVIFMYILVKFNISKFNMDIIYRNKKYILYGSIVLALGCVLLKNQIFVIINRFIGSDILHQFNSRGNHVEMAIYYFKQHPILGLGLNNYLDYTIIDFASVFGTNFFVTNPIHNAYLLFLVEIGIFGGISYILIMVNNLLYYRRFKGINYKKCSEYKGYIVAIIVCGIYNMQGWGALQNRTLTIFFIISALLYNLYYSEKIFMDKSIR